METALAWREGLFSIYCFHLAITESRVMPRPWVDPYPPTGACDYIIITKAAGRHPVGQGAPAVIFSELVSTGILCLLFASISTPLIQMLNKKKQGTIFGAQM